MKTFNFIFTIEENTKDEAIDRLDEYINQIHSTGESVADYCKIEEKAQGNKNE